MVDIENELFTKVAAVLREKYSGIYVTGEYLNAPSSFPAVSVIEMDNTTYDVDSSGETHAQLMYEVNVYSNLTRGKKSQCKEIANVIDGIFTGCGFSRIMKQPVPNMNDATIYRIVARYRGVADKDKNIYRR